MKLEGLVHATVLLPIRQMSGVEHVALARKTRVIGEGQYNGTGGGVDPGETIDHAMVREPKEEWGIEVDPAHLERRAVINCHNYNKRGERFVCRLFIATARRFAGEPELQPDSGMQDLAWFLTAKPPLEEMMFGDRVWMERVLKGERIAGDIYYDRTMAAFEREPEIRVVSAEELDRSWVLL